MQFTNSLEVPLPPGQAWSVLLNIPRIMPCMPGAELTEVVDDKTYKGKVSVRLGRVALAFSGTARFEEIDGAALRATVKAQGADTKERGGANATSRFQLEPSPAGTRVAIVTDLNLSGSVAQYGRSAGMIQEVAAQLIRQFAANLRAEIARTEAPSAAAPAVAEAAVAAIPPPQAPTKPISGFSLMLRVLWSSIRRLFRQVPDH